MLALTLPLLLGTDVVSDFFDFGSVWRRGGTGVGVPSDEPSSLSELEVDSELLEFLSIVASRSMVGSIS